VYLEEIGGLYTNIDQRGKELLNLCICNQIRILNGRVLGEMFGNYTCDTSNGSSVVDYVLVSENILEQMFFSCIFICSYSIWLSL
jgi:hypothetical protein